MFSKVVKEIRHHLASGQECLHDEVSDFLKNRAEIRCCLCLGHLISGLLIFFVRFHCDFRGSFVTFSIDVLYTKW